MQLETQLAVQEDDSTIVATYFSSTSAFIQSWGVLKDEISTFDAAMRWGLDQTQERISSIAQQLYSTESLRDQMSSSISSFSSMIDSVENLDLCSFRCCCMPVLLVISYTCELDPTTSARVRQCSSLVHSLVPWAGNDVFRQVMSPASARLGNASL